MKSLVDAFARDRRLSKRYTLRTALRVRAWKSSIPEERAESTNLSKRGIFFVTTTPHEQGEVVQILLKMPREITGDPPTEWRCTGSVVRVVAVDSPKGNLGIGVRFDCYEVSRTALDLLPARAMVPMRTISMVKD